MGRGRPISQPNSAYLTLPACGFRSVYICELLVLLWVESSCRKELQLAYQSRLSLRESSAKGRTAVVVAITERPARRAKVIVGFTVGVVPLLSRSERRLWAAAFAKG